MLNSWYSNFGGIACTFTITLAMGRPDGVDFSCDGCGSDLSNLVQIRCAECKEYELCVPCFAKGVHTGDHKPYHAYRVISQHSYPIFTDDWGADEELQLIEGCEQYGLGSWQDIADHIGGRTKEEVGQHYEQVYINSPTYPIPPLAEHFHVDPTEFVDRKRRRLEAFNAEQSKTPVRPRPAISSIPSCHEIQGFMPARLEFDVEGENEAEMGVKDMIFEPDDTETDIEHKLTVLEIYNSRLVRRAMRKRAIFAHHITEDYRRLAAQDKRRSKEDRDLVVGRLKPYIQVLPHNEYLEFTESILAEQQYRQRIAELQEYRQNGIRTIAEAQKYEKDKQARYNALNRTSLPAPTRQSFQEIMPGPGPTIKIRKFGSGVPLDVSQAPDVELLSPQERGLCTQLRMQPRSYLAVKESVLQNLVQNGGSLKKKALRDILGQMDEAKVGRIYDFFQTQNWIA